MAHSFLYLKMVKIYFYMVSPFGLFWFVKHLNFGKSYQIDSPSYFLESRHPEVTKNPYYVLSPKGRQKKVKAQGLIPVRRGAYILYFKINPPIFCSSLFSENYFNLQARINKMINMHTVDYHPSPSELISRIHSPIFLWNPKKFTFTESFWHFFLNLYISPWLRKSIKFIVFRLLENKFVSQKLNLPIFTHVPK